MSDSIPLDTVLATRRCRLRAPSEADFPHIFSASRYPGFNDGMLWEPPPNLEALHGPLVTSRASWVAGTAYSFTLETLSEAFLGRISIRQADRAGVWDIGFWTHPTQQGQGYMTEAAARVLEFGFTDLEAEAIGACHALWNRSSRRVLEKIGMRFVRHVPEGFQKNGVWVAEDCLCLSRREWASG